MPAECVTPMGATSPITNTRSEPREAFAAGNSADAGRSVTSKVWAILMTFTEGSEHSLTEIARLAGLPISTAHRLTSELGSWRLLERTAARPARSPASSRSAADHVQQSQLLGRMHRHEPARPGPEKIRR
jgi:hypothetical protein